jgi:hypothetical protein
VFVPDKLSKTSLIFSSKVGAYLSVHISGALLYGRLLALPTNITLGSTGLTGTNTPALTHLFIMMQKSIMTIGLG